MKETKLEKTQTKNNNESILVNRFGKEQITEDISCYDQSTDLKELIKYIPPTSYIMSFGDGYFVTTLDNDDSEDWEICLIE